MNGIEIKKLVKTILVSIILVLPLYLVSYTSEAYASSRSFLDVKLYELKEGWQYRVPGTNKWVATNYSAVINDISTSDIITMKVYIPKTRRYSPFLFIKSRYQDIEAYCGDDMIYSRGCLNNGHCKGLLGYHWHNIPINPSYSGKEIVLKLRPMKIKKVSGIVAAYLGSPTAFFVTQLKQDMKISIPGTILVIAGVFVFMIYVFKRRNMLIMLPLSLFSICVGLHSIAATSITKDLIYNNPVFWYYAIHICNFLMPVFFLMAVQLIFKEKKRRIMEFFWVLLATFAVFAFIADTGAFLTFSITFRIYIAMLAIIIPIASAIIYIPDSTGGIYYKILRICYTVLIITAVIDMVSVFAKNKPSEFSFISFGTLFFLLALFFLLERSIYEAEEKISVFSNEIKQKDASLIENQKLLQQTVESEKIKSEFFANVSHEFRTPLNILLSNLQLMNHYVKTGDIKSDTKDIGKYMSTMKQNCYRLLRLINNIIDLTKIDSGYLHPVMKNCDIAKEIKELVLSVSVYAESKGLELKFHSDAESFITACDPEKLERIILNLLSNAIKFSGNEGSITVLLNCTPEKVTITVSDTGIGIPEDKLSSIFNRFSQVDMSLTKSYEGSGIGLSLVRSLIEMQGGSIMVQSELGKGSDFIVTLPVKLLEEDECSMNPASSIQKCFNESINIEFSDISK